MRHCCRQHLLEILDFITTLLVQSEIPYWLNFGALLGAVRDGRMIPWDEDIDVGIWKEDHYNILYDLRPEIEAAGYDIKDAPYCTPINYSKKNHIHVDLSHWILDGAMARCEEYPSHCWSLNNIKTRSVVMFEQRVLWCPSDPEYGLRMFYGEDWATPKIREWQYEYIKLNPEDNAYILERIREEGIPIDYTGYFGPDIVESWKREAGVI